MVYEVPVTSLTIITTDQCTAECAHCCMNSSPKRRARLAADDMVGVISHLAEKSPLHTVVFAGGEPTLLKEKLLSAIAVANSLGLNTRIVTNASWATTHDRAMSILSKLHGAGLKEINISADDFHLPYIPFDRVATLWRAAKNFPFASVIIANCTGPESKVTPEWIMNELGEVLPLRFDDEGKANTAEFQDNKTYYGLSNARLQRLARGKSHPYMQPVIIEKDPANLNLPCPYAGRNIALGPDAELLACCGFEFTGDNILRFGDTRRTAAVELLRGAYDSVILNAISSLGPYFLMKFVQAVAPDLVFQDHHGSICEICQEVVTNELAMKALADNMSLLSHVVVERTGMSIEEGH